MSNNDAFAAKLASTIVRDHGLASIWRLNVIAAEAYRNGCPNAAAKILEIADAVENRRLDESAIFAVWTPVKAGLVAQPLTTIEAYTRQLISGAP
jgi:hypothetical protein